MNATDTLAAQDLADVVVKALRTTATPISTDAIRKLLTGPFKSTTAKHAANLESLVAAGRVFQYPPNKGKAPLFWDRGPDVLARDMMLSALGGKKPLAAKDLKALSAKVAKVGYPHFDDLLERLIAEGRVFKIVPPSGRGALKYSSHEPNLRAYFKKLVDGAKKTIAQLGKAGISQEAALATAIEMLQESISEATAGGQVRSPSVAAKPTSQTSDRKAEPVSPVIDDRAIVERIIEFDPAAADGAMISMRQLRRALDFQFPEHGAFDAAMLGLESRRVVVLHRHDLPTSLSAEEREQCVVAGEKFYVGASIRLE